MQAFLTLFLLTVSVSYAYAAQKCYDCEPSDQGRCENVEANSVKTTICAEDHPDSLILDYVCFTFVVDNGNDKNGTYRGCAPASDDCEELKKRAPGLNLDKCNTCSGDECNIENFGIDTDNNGVDRTSAWIGMLVVGVIYAVRLF